MSMQAKKFLKSNYTRSNYTKSDKIFAENFEKNKRSDLSIIIQNNNIIKIDDNNNLSIDFFIDGALTEAGLSIYGISIQGTKEDTENNERQTIFSTHCMADLATLNYVSIHNGNIEGKVSQQNLETTNNIDVATLENEFIEFLELFQKHFFVDENGDFSAKKLEDFFIFINKNHLEEEYLSILQELIVEYNKYYIEVDASPERPRIIFENQDFLNKINEIRKSFELKENIINFTNNNHSRVKFEQERYELKEYINQISHFINLKQSVDNEVFINHTLSENHKDDIKILRENLQSLEEYAEKLLKGTLTEEESNKYKELLIKTTDVLESLVEDFIQNNGTSNPTIFKRNLINNQVEFIKKEGKAKYDKLLHQYTGVEQVEREASELLKKIKLYSKNIRKQDLFKTQEQIKQEEKQIDKDFQKMRTHLKQADEVAMSVLDNEEIKELERNKRYDEIEILMNRSISKFNDLEKFYYDLNTQSGGGDWLKHLEPTTKKTMQIIFGVDTLPEYLTKQEVFARFELAMAGVDAKHELLKQKLNEHNIVLDENIFIKDKIYQIIGKEPINPIEGFEKVYTIMESEASKLAKENFDKYRSLLINFFNTPEFTKILEQYNKKEGTKFSIENIPTNLEDLKKIVNDIIIFTEKETDDERIKTMLEVLKYSSFQLMTARDENDLKNLNIVSLIQKFNDSYIEVDNSITIDSNFDIFKNLYLIMNFTELDNEKISLLDLQYLQDSLKQVVQREGFDLTGKDILQLLRENISNLNDLEDKDIERLQDAIDYIRNNSQNLIKEKVARNENCSIEKNDVKQDMIGIIEKISTESLAILMAQDMFKRFTYLSDDYRNIIKTLNEGIENPKNLTDNTSLERIGKIILETCTKEQVKLFMSRDFKETINLRKQLLEEYEKTTNEYKKDRLLEALNYVDNKIVGQMLLGEKGFEHFNSETFKYLKIKEIKDQIILSQRTYEQRLQDIPNWNVEKARDFIFNVRNQEFINDLTDEEKKVVLDILQINSFDELRDNEGHIYPSYVIYHALKDSTDERAISLFDKYKEDFSEKFSEDLEKKPSLFRRNPWNVDIFREEAKNFAKRELAEQFVIISEREKELQKLFTNIQVVDKEFIDKVLKEYQDELRYLGIVISKENVIKTDEASTSIDTNYVVAQLREKCKSEDAKTKKYAEDLITLYDEMVKAQIEKAGLLPNDDKKESFLSEDTIKNMKHTVDEIINGTVGAEGGVQALLDSINGVATPEQREAILYILTEPNGLSLYREFYFELKDGIVELAKNDEQIQNLIGVEIFSRLEDKTKKEVFRIFKEDEVEKKFKKELFFRAYEKINENDLNKLNEIITNIHVKENNLELATSEIKQKKEEIENKKKIIGNEFFGELSANEKRAKDYIFSLDFFMTEEQKQELKEKSKEKDLEKNTLSDAELFIRDIKVSLLTKESKEEYEKLKATNREEAYEYLIKEAKIDWDKLPEECKLKFAREFLRDSESSNLDKAKELFERIVNPEVYESKKIEEILKFIKNIEEQPNINESTGEVKEPREIKSWDDLTEKEKDEFKAKLIIFGNDDVAKEFFDKVCKTIKPLEQAINEKEKEIIFINSELERLRIDLESTKETIDRSFESSLGIDFKDFAKRIVEKYKKENPEIKDDIIYSLKFEVLDNGTVKISEDNKLSGVNIDILQKIVNEEMNKTGIMKTNIATLIESADLTGHPETSLDGLFSKEEIHDLNKRLKDCHLEEVISKLQDLTEEEKISILKGPIGDIIKNRCQDFEHMGAEELANKHIISQKEAEMIAKLLRTENSSEIFKAVNNFETFRENINDPQAVEEVLIHLFKNPGIGIPSIEKRHYAEEERTGETVRQLEETNIGKTKKDMIVVVEVNNESEILRLEEIKRMKELRDIIENSERTSEEKIIDIANKLFEGERHNAILTKDERDKVLKAIEKIEHFNGNEYKISSFSNSMEVIIFVNTENPSQKRFDELARKVAKENEIKLSSTGSIGPSELISKLDEISSLKIENIIDKDANLEGLEFVIREISGEKINDKDNLSIVEMDGQFYVKTEDDIYLINVDKLQKEFLVVVEDYGVRTLVEDTLKKELNEEAFESIKTSLGVEKTSKSMEDPEDKMRKVIGRGQEEVKEETKEKESKEELEKLNNIIKDDGFVKDSLSTSMSNLFEIKNNEKEKFQEVAKFIGKEYQAYINGSSEDTYFHKIINMVNEELNKQERTKEEQEKLRIYMRDIASEIISNPNVIMIAESGDYEIIQTIVRGTIEKAIEEFDKKEEVKTLREEISKDIILGDDKELRKHLTKEIERLSRLELEELQKQLHNREIDPKTLNKDCDLEKMINDNNKDRAIGRTTIYCDAIIAREEEKAKEKESKEAAKEESKEKTQEVTKEKVIENIQEQIVENASRPLEL